MLPQIEVESLCIDKIKSQVVRAPLKVDIELSVSLRCPVMEMKDQNASRTCSLN